MKKINYLLLFSFISFMASAQDVTEVSREWTSFTQALDIQSKTKKKFKVVASVKLETKDTLAWAGVWARVDTNNDESGFFDNMKDRPIRSNKWKSYAVEGIIDENSKTLNFGGICKYNGEFYFDKFELYIENDKGDFESVEIDNSSFETKIENGRIPKWNLGISKNQNTKIKEFTIKSSNDAVDGNSSILIEGNNITPKTGKWFLKKVEGASPQISNMISMLENLKGRVERITGDLSLYQTDHLHDEKANRIGSLIMHLAAAEVYYQVYTFEGRGLNEEEKKQWLVALELDDGGRDEFKGKEIQYYLDIYSKVRKKTIEELKKRNDEWFEEINPGNRRSNQFAWFHVMEHQSSHLGQILFLKKRIPPENEIKKEEEIKG